MKMKEACMVTGLSERTIRFYMQKGLVTPQTRESNGRIYSEFSNADITSLKTTATLRKMLFSIEEIVTMQKNPAEIGSVVTQYRERIEAEAELLQTVLALPAIQLQNCKTVLELAQLMREPAAVRTLPQQDLEPNFAQFEEEAQNAKEAEYQRFLNRQAQLELRGEKIVLVIAIANVIFRLLNLFTGQGAGELIFGLILDVAFSVMLFCGIAFARWLFAISLTITGAAYAVATFQLLFATVPNKALVLLLIAGGAIYSLTAAFLLVFSRAVREFLYRQRNG